MPASPTGLQNRKFPRRAFVKPVGVLLQGKYIITTTSQIGEGGINFDSDYALLPDQEVVVTFQVPGAGFLCLRTVIKNIKPIQNGLNNYGGSFTDISVDNKRLLRGYISSQAN